MKVIIGGAGITGLAVGCYLQQKGIDFKIFDQGYEVPETLVWRSTGIQLASNCHFVFKELGIYDQIKEASIERKNLKVYSEQNYLNDLSVTNDHDEGTFFIRRSELISILTSLIPSQKISRSTSILRYHDEIRGHDDHEKPTIEDYGTHVEVETDTRLRQNPFDWVTILDAEKEAQNIQQQFESGLLTREERYNKFKAATKYAYKISQKDRERNFCRHTADLYIDCTGSGRHEFPYADITQFGPKANVAVWGVSDYSDEMLKSFNNFMYSGMHFVTYPLTKNKTAFTLVMNNNFLLNVLQLHPLQKGEILKYLKELFAKKSPLLPSYSYEGYRGLLDNLYHLDISASIEDQDRTREFMNKLLKEDKFKDLINNLRYCSCHPIHNTTAHNSWYDHYNKGNIIYLGDSAHAITPHLAQGAAQGLIDAAYLNRGFSANLSPEEHLKFRNSIINGDFFAKRNSIINKIRSQSNLNKNIYQLGMPFKLFRNIYLKLYKPNYDWLFNSKYDEA